MIDFLFTSALFGRVVANNPSVAGATGELELETVSVLAIAAAAAVAISKGPVRRSVRARYGISDK